MAVRKAKIARRARLRRAQMNQVQRQQQQAQDDQSSDNNNSNQAGNVTATEQSVSTQQQPVLQNQMKDNDNDEALRNLTDEERHWLYNHYEEELYPNPLHTEPGSSMVRGLFSSKTTSPVYSSAEILRQHLDEVHPDTIGRIKDRISDIINNAPTFAHPILQLLREEGDPLPLRDPSNTASRIASKGVPKQHINPIVADAFWIMLTDPKFENKQLFSPDPSLDHVFHTAGQYRRGEIQLSELPPQLVPLVERTFYAGIFTVDKTEECALPECLIEDQVLHYLQRIIVDGRMANAHLQNPANMEIFRLDVLFDCFARCKMIVEDKRKKQPTKDIGIITLSADLRHWFHQIPHRPRCRQKHRQTPNCVSNLIYNDV
jgi:hypothetical protein